MKFQDESHNGRDSEPGVTSLYSPEYETNVWVRAASPLGPEATTVSATDATLNQRVTREISAS